MMTSDDSGDLEHSSKGEYTADDIKTIMIMVCEYFDGDL